jgi:hypothetical protein
VQSWRASRAVDGGLLVRGEIRNPFPKKETGFVSAGPA